MAKTQLKVLLMFACILGSQTTTGDQCLQNLKNIAVYEGQQNTIMNLSTDPNNVKWTVRSTQDELSTYTISNFNGYKNPALTGLYDVNQTGLVIKDATTSGNPISTAGLYIGQCANTTNRTGAKLLVVHAGPLCSCTPSDYASNVSCNVTFADSSLHPIYPIVTWKLNGVYLASYTLPRKRVAPNVFYAESRISDISSASGIYTCELTFAPPTDIQFQYIARNAPEFNESCSTEVCPMTTTAQPTTQTTATPGTTMTSQPPSYQCLQNLRNIAVYEGQQITIMNLSTDPNNVKWTVRSTQDELSTYTISNFNGYRNPSLTGLYDVNQTGLIIKEATTNGNPISTAGMYIGQCVNNTNKTGAKLLVVRTGPQCSRNSNSSSVLCNVTFADSTYNPIHPIITWKLNGANLTSYTLQRKRIDTNVFYAESTITSTSGAPKNYTCELTFAAPTNIQFDFIATNAPEFNESCSITG